MTPSDSSADGETDPEFVYCSSCGSKAPASWSFCRSCQSSLADADPAGDDPEWTDEAPTIQETGCPKCGYEEAEVDKIATTGAGLSRLVDVQNRQFQVVSCTRCGYSELYRAGDADVILDLFLGGYYRDVQ